MRKMRNEVMKDLSARRWPVSVVPGSIFAQASEVFHTGFPHGLALVRNSKSRSMPWPFTLQEEKDISNPSTLPKSASGKSNKMAPWTMTYGLHTSSAATCVSK